MKPIKKASPKTIFKKHIILKTSVCEHLRRFEKKESIYAHNTIISIPVYILQLTFSYSVFINYITRYFTKLLKKNKHIITNIEININPLNRNLNTLDITLNTESQINPDMIKNIHAKLSQYINYKTQYKPDGTPIALYK